MAGVKPVVHFKRVVDITNSSFDPSSSFFVGRQATEIKNQLGTGFDERVHERFQTKNVFLDLETDSPVDALCPNAVAWLSVEDDLRIFACTRTEKT